MKGGDFVAEPQLPSVTDAVTAGTSLIDKGKKILDQGKAAGGRVLGVNAAQEDARKIVTIVTDPNRTTLQQIGDVIDTITDRTGFNPSVHLLPNAEVEPTTDPEVPGKVFLIPQFIDP